MLLVQSESYIRRTSLESLAEQTWFEIGSHFPDYLGAELLAFWGVGAVFRFAHHADVLFIPEIAICLFLRSEI